MTNVKILEVNELGRDFVIGDLHGSFDSLQTALAGVKFDPRTDRLISVGDLVDRGPKSLQCLRLLREPWFHAVFANHEDLMQQFLNNGPYGRYWSQNGGDWWYHLQGDEILEAKQLVEELVDNLPYILTVNQKDGSHFHVCHAEFYTKVTDKDLEDPQSPAVLQLLAAEAVDGQAIIWGRSLFVELYNAHMDDIAIRKFQRGLELHKALDIFSPELSMVYCGHSILRQPTQVGGMTNLDTGAYAGERTGAAAYRGLTITEPATGKFWLATPDSFNESQLLKI